MGQKDFIITTVVSDDKFRGFIPLFLCAAKKAYPEADVKVFFRGQYSHPDVLTMQFGEYPNVVSLCNSLRYLIPDIHFTGYKWWFSTDVDTMIMRPKVDHISYYKEVMDDCHIPYAGARGPYSKPHRKEAPDGWNGYFTRIASGSIMFRLPEFLLRTRAMRKHYRTALMKQIPDPYDHALPGTYREYDEVMLYRIMKGSALRTPHYKNKFPNNKSASTLYRGVHLGDFKFRRRFRERKMRSLIHDELVEKWRQLEKDPEWSELHVEGHAKELLTRCRKYMLTR